MKSQMSYQPIPPDSFEKLRLLEIIDIVRRTFEKEYDIIHDLTLSEIERIVIDSMMISNREHAINSRRNIE